ncbi:hypothetical protein ABGB17_17110 [Sphaerisporangium sp. B11E5]|uniref:hypothetical protein n=1 Tax=Sphaerisporangium sp. B11E5 TaxID=3153563 RepID=UPI00325D3B6D
MSYIDGLVAVYGRFVSLPWQKNLAAQQRVWMAVYPPEYERRLRLHLPSFKAATNKSGHPWASIDITTAFENWMASHEYRDAYFEDPELIAPALPAFFKHLTDDLRSQLAKHADPNGVVGLLGAGSLFGLGAAVKVSALLNEVSDCISGRLLVFFPGGHEGNIYRLLDARDGWNYLAIPLTPNGNSR